LCPYVYSHASSPNSIQSLRDFKWVFENTKCSRERETFKHCTWVFSLVAANEKNFVRPETTEKKHLIVYGCKHRFERFLRFEQMHDIHSNQ
jgi:hypothetical protein